MEYKRMVNHLKDVVCRAHKGNKRVREMDLEAIKEALERFEEDVPERERRGIGFQIGRE